MKHLLCQNKKQVIKHVAIVSALILVCSMAFVLNGCNYNITYSYAIESNTTTSDITTSLSEVSSATSSKNSSTPTSSKSAAYIKYNGESLSMLYDRNLTATEQKIINEFTKECGVNINITVAKPNEYATKLSTLISNKKSPDVVVFDASNFPGFVVKSLRSLNISDFNLDDACWDKEAMNTYKYNSKVFAVVANDSWQYEQGSYVMYYNTNTLSGLADPYSLYKQGKWSYQTAKNIAISIKNKGSDYSGMSFASKDLYMLSSGVDFMSYNKTAFASNLNNEDTKQKILTAWNEMSILNQEGLLKEFDASELSCQKVGLITATAYGMSKESGWFDAESKNLRAVPIATPNGEPPYTVKMSRVFGTAKGSDNDELAAYFISYFTNAKHYTKDMFYNESLYNTYLEITANKNAITKCTHGVMNYTTAGAYEELCNELAAASIEQQTIIIEKYSSRFPNQIKRANAQLQNAK